MARRIGRRKGKRRGGPHKFTSKAQWRFLHAKFGHKGFVERWAEKQKGQYKALPRRKGVRKHA